MFEKIRQALFPTSDEIMAKIALIERLTGRPYGFPGMQIMTANMYVKCHGVETREFLGVRKDN